MGSEGGNKNLSGLPMYHLRRIGPQPNKARVINVMDLYRVTYMIGRSEVQVDFYIDSSNHIQSASISRCHARVVRQTGNQHRLYDDSLNGVFVNNMKIAGSCVLREGDKVTFGHPCGARLPPGSRSRQPDSHHQFMFEICTCEQTEQNLTGAKGDRMKETTGFKKPVSPVEASCSNSAKQSKKPRRPVRKPTQCFSSDDIRQLKQAWDEKQASSASDTSDMEDSASEAENESKVIKGSKNIPENDEQTTKRKDESEIDESVVTHNLDGNEIQSAKQSTSRKSASETVEDTEILKSHRVTDEKTSENIDGFKEGSLMDTETSTQNDLNESNDAVSNSDASETAAKNDLSTLEGTVNSLMKDLCDLRGKIEDSVEQTESQVPVMFKSPTKDACIQTSQYEKTENSLEQTEYRIPVTLKSPTKDACIQTSQNETVSVEVGKKLVTSSPVKDTAIQTSQLFPSHPGNDTIDRTVVEKTSIKTISDSSECNDLGIEVNDDEGLQGCNETNFESKGLKDVEKIDENVNKNVKNCVETIGNVNDMKDEQSIGKSGEALPNYIELAEEGCSEQSIDSIPKVEFSGDPSTVEKGLSNEGESVDEESDNEVDLPDLDERDAVSNWIQSSLKEYSVEGESDEDTDKEVINNKQKKLCSEDSNECLDEDKVSEGNETNDTKQPSLILSDSVAYDGDEGPDLLFSNSVEYSGSESDRNLSDSENEEADLDVKEGSIDREESEDEDDDNDDCEGDSYKNKDNINTSDISQGNCSKSADGQMVHDEIENEYNDNEFDGSDCDVKSSVPTEKYVDESMLEKVDSNNEVLIDGEVSEKVNIDEIVERKRKNSEEGILETECDNLRKRHCSDTANVLKGNEDECAAVEDNDSSSVSSNVSEEESMSSSQIGLKKLKKGVKKFFKFWSKKSYQMNSKNETKDAGYIYLQDHTGNYKLLDIDIPDDLVDVTKSKDVEGSDNGEDRPADQCQHVNASTYVDHCENSSSNEIEETEDIEERDNIDGIGEDLADRDEDIETSVSEKDVEHVGKDMDVESIDEMTEDILETEVKGGLEEDENSDTVDDIESSDRDIVESSMCQTDNEIDTNEMIKPSVLSSVFRTSLKRVSKMDVENSLSSSSVVKSCSNQHIPSQSQSPIIAKQVVHMNNKEDVVNTKSSATKLFDNESRAEVSSELSCKFSDDDDDNFFSPEIDFNNLGDSDDNDICDDDDDDEDKDNDTDNDADQELISEDEENVEYCKVTEVDADAFKGLSEVDKREKEMMDSDQEEFDDDNENDKNETEKVESTKKDQSNEEEDDPLESFINHDTEEDEDNGSTDSNRGEDTNGVNEIDFDFCDSEAEGETSEKIDNDKSEDIVIDSEDDEDDDDDGDVNHLSDRRRRMSKRKCDSDFEDSSSKKQKSPASNEASDDNLSPEKGENSSLTTFKTPVSLLKTKHSSTPNSSHKSLFNSSSNSLLDSPHTRVQTQDLDGMSMTQVSKVTEHLEEKLGDKSRSEASRNKAKDLLEKLKAKRRIKEEAADPVPSSPTPSTSQSTEIELYNRTGNRERSQAQIIIDDVNKHVNSCRKVIMKMKAMFGSCGSLQRNPRVEAWRKELSEVEKRLEFPKTVIAVVGDTGSGKSSLMNAILDHRSVLPTSGIRACTAVVVEVVNNKNSQYFEADIEFLQRQEWMEELQVLLKDLTGLDGTVKNRPPDPTSDAFVSYCKVKAVYGRIDKFEVLARLTTVTHWLGRVKVIKSTKPGEFRRQVEKYIETQEPGAGGQYWPIVKHVRLRMPNCDVCSSGASLVDLPGVRDSNAARDKIAKEYLKNCTAVWVVSSIHRAIDDKTAKDLLGENFRRQLLMDGQYGSIAFICTKTDVLMPSEIIRPLELEDQTREHEDKINEMESEKNDLELVISNATKETRTLKKTIASVKTEAKELRDNLSELSNLIDTTDLDNSQSEEKEAIEEYEKELKEKVEELNTAENRLDELHDQKLEATQKTLEIEKVLGVHRKAIASICARARNDYSKSQIKRDFKAGLKEMKRRAGMLNDNDDEEDDIYSDDDDDEVGSHAENLKVFCCSSTEYQKMKNLLTDDGPPQVFSSVEDTQIPALRHYVHEMTSVRHKQWLERLIRNVGRFVFDLHMYVSEGGDMKSRDRAFAKTAIDAELQKFDISLAPVYEKLTSNIDDVFDGSIRQKVEEGATNAATEANDTCFKWGAPVNRDQTKDKKSGGLHWATYRAAVRRQGVFTSHSWGPVDFNEDLSEPMYRNMTIVWDRAFSGMLWRILDKLKDEILIKLKTFIADLTPRLAQLGIQATKTVRVSSLLLSSASNKLTEMATYLKEIITNKQRDISRIITPIVQTSLLPEYMAGAAESGPGTYMRIKTCMSNGIDTKRFTMFDEASQQLMKYLVDLQNEIVHYVRQVCQSLIQDLRTAFEPLWEAPANTSVIRSAFREPIGEVCTLMHNIYDEAGLSHLEERALMSASSDKVEGNASSTMATSCNSGMMGAGGLGMRIKTERLSQSSISENISTVPSAQTFHIKQEKKQDEFEGSTSAVDESLLNFGCQMLKDLQCGKLEVSPVEVTVKTTPSTSSGPAVMVMPPNQLNTIRLHKPGNITGSSIGGNGHVTNTKSATQSSYGLPSGSTLYQVSSLATGQKALIPNLNKPESSAINFLPKPSISNTLPNSTLLLSTPSVGTEPRVPSSNLMIKLASQACGSSSTQQQKGHVNKPGLGGKHGTPVVNSSQRQSSVPTLNMVFGKENVSVTPVSRNSRGVLAGSQQQSGSSSHSKVKNKGRLVNLSRSQMNSPVRTPSPSPVIKTEPVDRGVYGRVKYLGSIDLTDD